MLRNPLQQIPLKASDAHFDMVSKAVFYKMHEGSGTTLEDSLGHGPNFTISAGTPLETNVGWFTPPSSNNTVYAQCTVANDTAGYLQDLFDFSTAYGHILIAFDLDMGIDIAAIQTIFGMGRSGVSGNFEIGLATTEILQVLYGGENRSANTTVTLVQDFTGLGRKAVLVEMQYTGAMTFDLTAYVDGASVAATTGDWSANSGTAPLGSNFGDGFLIGARYSSTVGGAKSNWVNAAASEDSKFARLFACRLDTAVPGIGLAVAKDLFLRPGEPPKSLRGL